MLHLKKLGCTNVKQGVEPLPQDKTMPTNVERKIEKSNSNVLASCSTLSPSSKIAATAGRSKVALKPGRSLMDWIRFTHSGCDLTSTNGEIKPVTYDELIKHNQKNDAWICLRGKVYNVTHYLEYHPGGEDELMKGAGSDATDLFNQIHKWVNAESMLQRCFIGPLKGPSLWMFQDSSKFPRPLSEKFFKKSKKEGQKFSWCQTSKNIHITIKNTHGTVQLCDIIADLSGKKLLIKQIMKHFIYIVNMELYGAVQDDYEIETDVHNNVNVIMQKVTESMWSELGQPLDKHNLITDNDGKYLNFRPCILVRKNTINYNTIMLSLKLPSASRMIVPIGCHVNIKLFIGGEEITRSYTPVLLFSEEGGLSESFNNILTFIIKIYDDGILTPVLNKCEIGEEVFISDYMGSFKNDIKSYQFLMLLAAGTGITPMIKIIKSYLKVEQNYSKLVLMFFNRSKRDIILHEELSALVKKDSRFIVCHILSEPDEDWKGETGHIRTELVKKIIPPEMEIAESFCFVCGTSGFCASALRCLEELSFHEKKIYIFSG